jgi:hypothetical protein
LDESENLAVRCFLREVFTAFGVDRHCVKF